MRPITVDGHDVRDLRDGWELADAGPDEHTDPSGIDDLDWTPADVPGTVASALRSTGRFPPRDAGGLDDRDWWFRTQFDCAPAGPGEEVVLALEGVATVAEVYVNGNRVLESESMFSAHTIDVGAVASAHNELVIRCRALGPLLAVPRRPRARWRTRLVTNGNLRFQRTMLLGRTPGFAPNAPVIGPWRGVRLERRRGCVVDELRLRPSIDRGHGRLALECRIRSLEKSRPVDRVTLELTGPSGTHGVDLAITPTGIAVRASGELAIPSVAPWWPHTHGDPVLHDARLVVEMAGRQVLVAIGRVGFRTLAGGDLERDGIQLRVNDVPVFVRGAVWAPRDLAMPCTPLGELSRALGLVVEAGMNMLRVPGTSAYESDAFYELCDARGILIWQDFMFANLDYPAQDAAFMAGVEREAGDLLASAGGRPSLAVLCGGSEVAQQVAMLGLDPSLASGPLFGELLPDMVRASGVDALYVPSTPWGGDLPFRTNRGVAHYYGVGAYLRGLEDVRRSEVRFAAECLAFSNVPDAGHADEVAPDVVVHHPDWKSGVPRDVGAGWDFEDVRDHYLRVVFGVDPIALRRVDHDRYLELSRLVTGEVMAEVFGEWRRRASPCGGGLVLWLTDLCPGAGWGVLDHAGGPKAAYHYLRRALAPVAVWSTDEGLNGIAVHVANDRGQPLRASLRVALYRGLETPVSEVQRDIDLPAHGGCAEDVEGLLGRFVDVSWAYRFGPPAQDLIVFSLERPGENGTESLSQSFRLPTGPPTRRESAGLLGISANVRPLPGGGAGVTVASRRLAYGVRIHVPGFEATDDAFSVEPGHERHIGLRPLGGPGEGGGAPHGGSVTALNLDGRIQITMEPGS